MINLNRNIKIYNKNLLLFKVNKDNWIFKLLLKLNKYKHISKDYKKSNNIHQNYKQIVQMIKKLLYNKK